MSSVHSVTSGYRCFSVWPQTFSWMNVKADLQLNCSSSDWINNGQSRLWMCGCVDLLFYEFREGFRMKQQQQQKRLAIRRVEFLSQLLFYRIDPVHRYLMSLHISAWKIPNTHLENIIIILHPIPSYVPPMGIVTFLMIRPDSPSALALLGLHWQCSALSPGSSRNNRPMRGSQWGEGPS